MELPDISFSMRSMYKSCPRKVFYRYVAGVERVVGIKKALVVGKAFHSCLEKYRDGLSVYDIFNAAKTDIESELSDGFNDIEIVDEVAKLKAYLTGYFLTYPDEGIVWEGEKKFKLKSEVAFIDAFYVDDMGFAWIVEDKTRSMFDPNIELALRLDEQILSYCAILDSLKIKLGGVYYRETLKSRLRRNKNETEDGFSERVMTTYSNDREKFYRQFVVSPSKDDILFYKTKRNHVNAVIKTKLKFDRKIESWGFNSSTCLGKFGSCDFLELCAGGDCAGKYRSNGKTPLDEGRFIDDNLTV